jgi:hypothetical protein
MDWRMDWRTHATGLGMLKPILRNALHGTEIGWLLVEEHGVATHYGIYAQITRSYGVSAPQLRRPANPSDMICAF